MPKVAIVTDSTAYIPADIQSQYLIHVAPQVLVWGSESFRDGVDIQPSEFYTRLKTARVMPTTSQASPRSFHEIFSLLLEQEYQVLSILIAEPLSGTIDSARQAKDLMPPGAPIEIVDSTTTAMAMGFQVLLAARAAQAGASLADCKALAERTRPMVGVLFAVDTLEFLHRGGRIGGASRLLGTALNIKPILEVANGHVDAVERVRTRKKSISRLVEILAERTDGHKPLRLAALHANAPEDACRLLEMASARLHPVETVMSEVSPVVGTHAGPGTVGLAYLAGL